MAWRILGQYRLRIIKGISLRGFVVTEFHAFHFFDQRETERDRDRHTDTDTETQTETDRQTDRQTNRQREVGWGVQEVRGTGVGGRQLLSVASVFRRTENELHQRQGKLHVSSVAVLTNMSEPLPFR